MDWVVPPIRHDFWNKNDDLIFFFFFLFSLSIGLSQYTMWTESSPQNDIIFEKKNWKKLLFISFIFICLANQFKSQYTVWTECSPQNDIFFFF